VTAMSASPDVSLADAAPPRAPLLARVLRSGGAGLAANLCSQALRLASNLVLTRLLYPEAFGLMAITQSILMAARLLSDVGLSQSIVRSARGHERSFCDTVWTLNILKDGSLFLVVCVAGPVAARLYHQPLLAQLVPAMAATLLVAAFNSTKLAVVNRRLEIGRLVLIELGAQACGIATMIAAAAAWRSPWALVAGNWATALALLAGSHLLLRGPANRFAWDRAAVREVMSFGGWVMLSSIVTFLLGEGSNLLNGWLVGPQAVGFLGLSTNLALVAWSTIQALGGRVFYPAYAEVWRDRPAQLSRVLVRSRQAQLLGGCAVALVWAVLGQRLVGLLYDPRYRVVGALLQIQAVGTIFAFASSSYANVLWAMGLGRLNVMLVAVQAASLFALLVLGHHLGGLLGLMTASSFIGLCIYPVNAWVFRRLGLWHPRTDAAVFAVGALAAAWVWAFGAWRALAP